MSTSGETTFQSLGLCLLILLALGLATGVKQIFPEDFIFSGLIKLMAFALLWSKSYGKWPLFLFVSLGVDFYTQIPFGCFYTSCGLAILTTLATQTNKNQSTAIPSLQQICTFMATTIVIERIERHVFTSTSQSVFSNILQLFFVSILGQKIIFIIYKFIGIIKSNLVGTLK